jgi:hypothetical protein
MKTLNSIILASAICLGTNLNSKAEDASSSLLNIANPASPLSPFNIANPCSPLNPLNTSSREEQTPVSGNLDFSYCSDRPEKILKYGLIGICTVFIGMAGYAYWTRS